MSALAQRSDLELDRTWKGQTMAQGEAQLCATVRTAPVKLVGTPQPDTRPVAAAVSGERSLSTTQRFGRSQPSVQEALASVAAALPDSEFDLGRDDAFEQALAFARTIPALTPEELGLSSSGVREVERLELWLEPRDRQTTAHAAVSGKGLGLRLGLSSTTRVSANAWQALCSLPAPLVIYAVATLCLLSALALRVLAQ